MTLLGLALWTNVARCREWLHPLCGLEISPRFFLQEITIDTTAKDIKDGKENLPPLRNPPLLETADDLATLSHLNEPSGQCFPRLVCRPDYLSNHLVLHTIRNRYAQHSIYTYSGIVLIAVNPFQRVTLYGPEVIQAYSGRKRGELEPHLFAIAEDAYTAMAKDGTGQTIIVSGERYSSPYPSYHRKLTPEQWCRKDRISQVHHAIHRLRKSSVR